MWAETCALCELFNHYCSKCPLRSCSHLKNNLWGNAVYAAKARDRKAFIEARNKIIEKMKKALKKEQDKIKKARAKKKAKKK